MKKSSKKKRTPRVEVTPEQRYHIVNDVAYFRALKRQQETGEVEDQAASWCRAEDEIDVVLKQHHARLRQPVRRKAYVVYISKLDDPHAIVKSRSFSTMDKAASACISLAEEGCKISKVKLPSGRYVSGEQIKNAIVMGRSEIKIALRR